MEYLEGRTLEEVLHGEGALSQPEAARLLAQLASALAVANERGVIHRDVRAANVILTDRSPSAWRWRGPSGGGSSAREAVGLPIGFAAALMVQQLWTLDHAAV